MRNDVTDAISGRASTAGVTPRLRPSAHRHEHRQGPALLGLSNAEIAETMFISHATAKTHVSRLLTKLVARDRAQLVMIAYESGRVTPGAG